MTKHFLQNFKNSKDRTSFDEENKQYDFQIFQIYYSQNIPALISEFKNFSKINKTPFFVLFFCFFRMSFVSQNISVKKNGVLLEMNGRGN